jgi:hypothetical protein
MKEKASIKVRNSADTSAFAIAIISIVLYVAGIRSFDALRELFFKGGWAGVVILYLTFQAYSSSWLLYKDTLVVKRPMRPFYNRFEFPLKDIEKVTYTVPNIGKLNPWLKVYCRNKRFKIYDFGFTGDREKMERLLSMLKEKNIDVQIKKGDIE